MLFPRLDLSCVRVHPARARSRAKVTIACLALAVATFGTAGQSHAQTADVLDDFNGPALNTSVWTYVNPLNDSPLTMTGTQVSISVPGNRNHLLWSGINTAPRIMQLTANTDFEIEAKFDSVVTLPYQMQGLRIEQNATNSIIVQVDHTGTNTELQYAHIVNNVASAPGIVTIPSGSSTYLKVLRRGNRFTISYSVNGVAWTEVVVSDRAMTVNAVGAYVGNYAVAGAPPAHVGVIDYFYKRAVAPVITTHPSNLTVTEPAAATFSVAASGSAPLTYQWRRNGAPIAGATAVSYTRASTTTADNGALFDVVVTNSRGSAVSTAALLRVNQPTTPPVAVPDTYSVQSAGSINTTLEGLPGVLANDFDANGDALTASLVSNVANGALTLNANGSFTYTHSGNDLPVRQLLPGAGNSLMEYGADTAIDGDTLVVGSNSTERGRLLAGAAYVFVRSGTDWILQAKLVPNDPVAIHFFGWAVAISGDTIVVGAAGDNFAGTYSGAAYIFERTGTTWTQRAKLIPSDTRAGDEFGTSVAIHGNTVVVGANNHDDGAANAGAAFVFVRHGNHWTQQAELRAPDPSVEALFGLSVAVHGDRIAVGAIYDDERATDAGATYLYKRTGAHWALDTKLTASDAAAGNTFGFALSIKGDRVLVGASDYGDVSGRPGGAYVYELDGSNWVEVQKLTAAAPPGPGFHGFGVSVALGDDLIVIGAHGDDQLGTNTGAAYVFERVGGTWTQQRKILSPQPATGGEFAVAVALDGNYAVFGANSAKLQITPDRANGSAYVYQVRGSLTDSFTYVANDGGTNSNPVTVTITIRP